LEIAPGSASFSEGSIHVRHQQANEFLDFGNDFSHVYCYNTLMKPEQLKAAIEKSGRLRLEYVERVGNGKFDGVYAAVLDAHSVLQTPYLVPLKRDFLESKTPEEVAETVESYVGETQRWGTDTSGI
jgi:hypothetical protein